MLSNAAGFFLLDPRMEAEQTFCSEIMLVEGRNVCTVCSKKLLGK